MTHTSPRLAVARRLLACLVALLVFSSATAATATAQPADDAPAEPERQPLAVLAIGNSFSWNATAFLPRIAQSAGHRVTLGHASLGGAPLDRHARHALAFADDPDAAEGRPYPVRQFPDYPDDATPDDNKISLRQALEYRDWDVVTLQQVSTKSFKPEEYEPHARQLIDLIREAQPDATIHVHQTWAYRNDSDRLERWGMPQQEMYEHSAAAYDQLARRYDLPQLPVGDAMQLARAKPLWQYRRDADYDYDNPTPPHLPDQAGSLIVGHFWRDLDSDSPRLVFDSIHANTAGKYLGGLVWFATLFDEDPRDVSFKPDSLTEAQAASLREVAQEAVVHEAQQAMAVGP